jgi:hypothetical protein
MERKCSAGPLLSMGEARSPRDTRGSQLATTAVLATLSWAALGCASTTADSATLNVDRSQEVEDASNPTRGRSGALIERSEDLAFATAGRDRFVAVCGGCHSVKFVVGKSYSRQKWATEMDRMIRFGADILPEDYRDILEYLATNFD